VSRCGRGVKEEIGIQNETRLGKKRGRNAFPNVLVLILLIMYYIALNFNSTSTFPAISTPSAF
jgi:hypothetical protein